MKKLIATTAVMTALLVGCANANAQPAHKTGMMPPPHHGDYMKPLTPEQKAKMEKRRAEIDKRLGVTEEQKAQLKAIHEKGKTQIAPKIKKLTEVQHEIQVIERKQMNKDKFGIDTLEDVKLSGKSLDQLYAESKTLKDEIRQIKKANFEEAQKVFTEEQKAELKKMREERMKKMAKKGHKHPHRPVMPPMEK